MFQSVFKSVVFQFESRTFTFRFCNTPRLKHHPNTWHPIAWQILTDAPKIGKQQKEPKSTGEQMFLICTKSAWTQGELIRVYISAGLWVRALQNMNAMKSCSQTERPHCWIKIGKNMHVSNENKLKNVSWDLWGVISLQQPVSMVTSSQYEGIHTISFCQAWKYWVVIF